MTDKSELTDEELCRFASQGDSLAEEWLLLRYRKVVLVRSRSFFLMGGDHEDLVQEGMIGLVKAIRHYDPQRGASFHTFVEQCINHALVTAVTAAVRKKHMPLNNSISLGAPLTESTTEFLLGKGGKSAPNPEELLITQEAMQERLEAIQNTLSQFEKKILKLYLSGLSYSDIAQQADCTVKSVDNAVQRIRKKLSLPS